MTSTGNLAKMLDAYDRAEAAGCDIVAFPELSTTGYPPEDLVLKPGFVADNLAVAVEARRPHRPLRRRRRLRRPGPRPLQRRRGVRQRRDRRHVPQAAAAELHRVRRGPVLHARRDSPIRSSCTSIGGVKVGISICEDIWSPFGPVAEQAAGGAELSININGSPFHAGKGAERERMLATRASDSHTAIVYVNQVGGQDELVFDGGVGGVRPRGRRSSPGRRSSSRT